MRRRKRTREVPAHLASPLEVLLEQFSAAAQELNPSIGAEEFARRLTSRAVELLKARAAALVLKDPSGWHLAQFAGSPPAPHPTMQRRLAAVVGRSLARWPREIVSGPGARIFDRELSRALGWRNVVLLPLAQNEMLGVLCLADLARPFAPAQPQLLKALAAYASIALENVRLFSRIENSRKQWVQDIDAISDFLLVHDDRGRVLRLNRSLAAHLARPLADAIGRSVAELRILEAPAGPDRCPFCRNVRVAREEFVHGAEGRTYWVSSSRIPSDAQGETRTVHVLKDITDRRQAERRYRQERDFNRKILNNTHSMILVLDSGGRVRYANRRCFEMGYREADLLGHPLVDMVPSARRSILAQAVDRALGGMAVDQMEIPVSRGTQPNGQFSVSLSPMRDEHGEIDRVVVVMTDVTDAATLQAKMMHTEKMAALGQLVSGVAHEVNNPLAAIVGFTDLLLESSSIAEDAKKDLSVILQEAQRTRQIVQNLLSFARQLPAQREPVRLNTVVRQTLKLRSYDLLSHGVEVVEHYTDELPLAMGDPHELQQVFLNILNNAYDAIREVERRGRIEVATCRRNGHVEVRFRDNGPGIRHADRIFDPFYTTKEVGQGTGLGLSICYGIVQAHRGEILAENNADGIGCTFCVRLPAATEKLGVLAGAEAVR